MLITKLERQHAGSEHGRRGMGEDLELRALIERLGSIEVTDYGQDVEPLNPMEIESMRVHYASDPKELLSRWSDWRYNARQGMQWQMASWLLYLLTWDGQPYLTVKPDAKVEPVAVPGWIPEEAHVHLNRARSLLLELISELNQPNAVLEAMPRTSSESDKEAARTATRVVWHWEDSTPLKSIKSDVTHWQVMTGNCFVSTRWNANLRGLTVNEKTGERRWERTGGVEFETVSPERVVFAERAYSLDEAERFVIESRRSVGWMEANYPRSMGYLRRGLDDYNGDDDRYGLWRIGDWEKTLLYQLEVSSIFGESRGYSSGYLAGSGSSGNQQDRFSEHPFLVRECFERCHDPEIGEYWWRTVICQQIILENEPYLPRDGNGNLMRGDDGRVLVWPQPLTHFTFYKQPKSVWGRGVMRDVVQLLRHLGNLDLMISKQAYDCSMKLMARQAGDKMSPVVRRGFTDIYYADKAPQVLDLGGVSEGLLKTIYYYEEKLEQVSLRPRVLRGQADPEDSGKKLQIMGEQAAGALDPIRQAQNTAWASVYRKGLVLMQQMATERHLLGANENDVSGVLAFKGADIEGAADVVPRLDVMWGMTRSARLERADHMLERGVLTPEEYRRVIQAGSREDLVDDVELQTQKARRIVAIIREMDERAAEELMSFIHDTREQLLAQAQQRQIPPAQVMIALGDLRNQLLLYAGLGIEDVYDAKEHELVIRRFELGLEFEGLSPAKRLLMEEQRKAAIFSVGRVEMQQAAAEEQSQDARAELVHTQGQRDMLEQASAAPAAAPVA